MSLNIKKEFGTSRSLQRKPDMSTLVWGKIPPQAPEMEEAVLGACMLEKDTLLKVLEIIKSEDCFYVDAHQKIYAVMRRLFSDGTPIDLLTITEALRKTNELELIGGAYYLTNLTMSVLSSAHAEAHAYIVMEKFMSREAIRIAGCVISEAYEDSTDIFDLLDRQNDELYKLTSSSVTKIPKSVSGIADETFSEMVSQSESKNDFTGIPTGHRELNAILCGWQNTDLIILAARPAVGKTAFIIEQAVVAAKAGFPVALFSLEMSAKQISKRMLAAESGIEMDLINNPRNLNEQEWHILRTANAVIKSLPIFIDDTAAITAIELEAKSRRLKQKHDIKFILIDYLQLMSGSGKEGNREQEISKISRDLKKLAKNLEVPVAALSQLNRGIEGQNGEATRDPKLSDLRESGAIEQDADIVIFITNPSKALLSENSFYMGKKIIHIAKHRNGATGLVPLEFNGATQKWKDPKGNEPEFPVSTPPDNPRAGMPGSSKLFIPGGGFQARSPLPPESDDKVPF